jgi:hypothetical protein
VEIYCINNSNILSFQTSFRPSNCEEKESLKKQYLKFYREK